MESVMNLSNPNNQAPLDEGLLLFECPICRDKSRTPPKIHFGVSSCFRCQVFFRQAHKYSKAPNFKCPNYNKCQGTQRWKTGRKCQKCRLNICLKMGMKPEAISKKRTTNHVQTCPEGASTTSNLKNNLSNPNNQPPLDEGLLLFECPICMDKFRTSPQIHYGVSSCFRCQAFFRKAHNNSKAPNFICENYNKCQGTQRWRTRRKCQKCRLDICLKMGMKPEAIFNFRGKRTTKHVQPCPEGASTTSNPQNNLSNPNNQPPLDEGLLLFECPICQDKLRTPPQIHYGGSSCFSCQAFFRRANKN